MNQLYQWQTVKSVNGQWPLHDPDQVWPRIDGPVGTLEELRNERPRDLDVGKTAWRLRKVR